MQVRLERADVSAAEPVLLVGGSLDLTSRDRLADAVQRILDAEGVRTLTIDLAGIDFVDSTGLGALVTARGEAEDRGVRLVLRSPSQRARRILEITGLLDVFTTVET